MQVLDATAWPPCLTCLPTPDSHASSPSAVRRRTAACTTSPRCDGACTGEDAHAGLRGAPHAGTPPHRYTQPSWPGTHYHRSGSLGASTLAAADGRFRHRPATPTSTLRVLAPRIPRRPIPVHTCSHPHSQPRSLPVLDARPARNCTPAPAALRRRAPASSRGMHGKTWGH